MRLLSTDIGKSRRLSLKSIKLKKPERRDPITPILVEKPPTDEDIVERIKEATKLPNSERRAETTHLKIPPIKASPLYWSIRSLLDPPPPPIQPEEEKEPEIRSIKEIGHIVEKVGKVDGKTLYRYSFKPGSLAELEDVFIKGKNKDQPIEQRVEIASLLDRYKRVPPTEDQMRDLKDKVNRVITVNRII